MIDKKLLKLQKAVLDAKNELQAYERQEEVEALRALESYLVDLLNKPEYEESPWSVVRVNLKMISDVLEHVRTQIQ